MTVTGEEVLALAQEVVDQNDRMRVALRQIADWSRTGAALYDPVADRYSLQLPGELVRRIGELTGDTEPPGSI